MTKHSQEEIRKFVVDCRAEERRLREFSPMEEKFWELAEEARYGTRVITTNDQVLADPYLMRVYLTPEREKLQEQLSSLGVPAAYANYIRYMPRPYLHYFFRGDDDRAYHNHPWKRSLSFILIGGYIEHVWNFELKRSLSRLFTPGKVNYLKRGTFHRAELLPGEKAWTLFVSTGRVQAADGTDWDFYDPETDTFTPWGKWTADQARRRDFKTGCAVARVEDEGGAAVSTGRSKLEPEGIPDDPDRGRPVWDWSSVGRV